MFVLLLRNVLGWERRSFAEQKLLHVFRHQVLRFFLPGHEAIFIEDHLHPVFPQLPCGRRDVVVDALTELARPWRLLQTRQLFAELLTHHLASALSHAAILPPRAHATRARPLPATPHVNR